MSQIPIIALMSDFGLKDWFVASMKGVILSHCHNVQLVDISHEIPKYDINFASILLASTVKYFPKKTVFVAVVDPGVGTSRPGLAIKADDQYYVGPDNGLFSLAIKQARRKRIVQLTNKKYWLKPLSRTFHGRDVFAPVAAHLACRKPIDVLGSERKKILSLFNEPLRKHRKLVMGRIVYIDHFGNLITNIPADETDTTDNLSISIRYKRHAIPVVSSYAFTKSHRLAALVNSLGVFELVLRENSAAKVCKASVGDIVQYSRK